MGTSPLRSPVVVDGVLSDEKLSDLLSLETEYPELDFKEEADLDNRGLVEFAKDVGAMQVEGGYILIGVDGHGAPTGKMNDADMRLWDEANLTPKLTRYLPSPLELRTQWFERDGSRIIGIYVGPNPAGCAVFGCDGKYQGDRGEVVKFRQGDVFWRNGTRSERMDQEGMNRIFDRRLANTKREWLEEQREIRSGEVEELAKAYTSRSFVNAPLGTVSFDLAPEELSLASLEMLRGKDEIALRHLLMSAPRRAKALIEKDEIETELGDVLDNLFCLAATFLVYDLPEPLDSVLSTVDEIVTLGFEDHDPEFFEYQLSLPAPLKGPRVWFLVLERAYALGALAVRREKWLPIHRIALRRAKKVSAYYRRDWLHHAMTMSSRAQHLQEEREDGQTVEVSLLSRARADTGNDDLSWPHCDGLIWLHPRPMANSSLDSTTIERGDADSGVTSGTVRADSPGSRARGALDPGAGAPPRRPSPGGAPGPGRGPAAAA